jgi:hypothetical protein
MGKKLALLSGVLMYSQNKWTKQHQYFWDMAQPLAQPGSCRAQVTQYDPLHSRLEYKWFKCG